MKEGFDNQKYIAMQAERIRERIDQFGGKLYLEFGGKLFDDYHASRVLPGFEPDSKIRMLQQLADDVEIIVAINASDIEKSKVRGDLGITYDDDVLRLMDIFRSMGFLVGGVVITQYDEPAGRRRVPAPSGCPGHQALPALSHRRLPLRHRSHRQRRGLRARTTTSRPTRPLVVVTAPGPGSGKMATCLSQLYHEHKRGVAGGLRQVRDVPGVEPAAEASGEHRLRGGHGRSGRRRTSSTPSIWRPTAQTTVNYNRDVEIFPVLKAMFERISGTSPYQSPDGHGREHGRLRHHRRRGRAQRGEDGDRASLLPDGRGGASAAAAATSW